MQAYQKLEQELSRWTKKENIVSCASGSAALHISLETLQLPRPSFVAIPDFTMIAVPRAVSLSGLMPFLIDVDDSGLMDLDHLADVVRTHRIRAILPVHTYGRVVNMDRLHSIAGDNIPVIEDLAEAHGVFPDPRSYAGAWSFYRNKVIAGEEGGAIAFRDKDPIWLAESLRCMGFTATHDFRHVPRGWNYRLSNVHAELIRTSLKAYWGENQRRLLLEEICNHECPEEWKMPPRTAPWVYDIRIPGLTKEGLDYAVSLLREANIEARHGFKPISTQGEYMITTFRGMNETSKRLSREILYLPLDRSMDRRKIQEAFEILLNHFEVSKGEEETDTKRNPS